MTKLKLALLLSLCFYATLSQAEDKIKSENTLNNIINFTVQAEKELNRDTMQATLFVEEEGENAEKLTNQVTTALNNAIAQTKAVDTVTIKSNNISSHARYSTQGKKNGWVVRGDLVLKSKNPTALSQLIKQLNDNKILTEGVDFSLSADKLKNVEDEITQLALEKFKQRAYFIQTVMNAKSYKILSLTLQTPEDMYVYSARATTMMSKSAVPEASDPMTLENGKTTLKTTIEAKIQLITD